MHSKHLATIGMILIFTTGLFFRLGYQSQTVIDQPLRADALQYTYIAWNMVNHGIVSMQAPSDEIPAPDSYRGPGYPALVALAMIVGGEGGWYTSLLTLQALLGGLSALLTVATARYWLPVPYAITAGLLVALWPHMVTLSGYVLTETLFGFLLALGLYLFCRTRVTTSLLWPCLAGLVFGYAALVNPVITPFPVIAAGYLALSQRRSALVILVLALLIPGAWSVRSANLDTPTTITSSGRLMENILVGMEPDYDFYYQGLPEGYAARERVMAALTVYREDKKKGWSEVFNRLTDNPAYYAKLFFFEKPPKFFSWPIRHGAGDLYVYPVITSAFESNTLYRTVAALSHGLNPLLMLGCFAMLAVLVVDVLRHGGKGYTPALFTTGLLLLYATAVHTVLIPEVRYSTPFRPAEILLAVSMAFYLVNFVRNQRQKASDKQATNATSTG